MWQIVVGDQKKEEEEEEEEELSQQRMAVKEKVAPLPKTIAKKTRHLLVIQGLNACKLLAWIILESTKYNMFINMHRVTFVVAKHSVHVHLYMLHVSLKCM